MSSPVDDRSIDGTGRSRSGVDRLASAVGGLTRGLRIDRRSVAAFRISIATVLLVDLTLRVPHIVAFSTDRGILPRAVLAESFPVFRWVSVHAVSGTVAWQALLLGFAAVVGCCLLIGYRTTAAVALSAYLLVSLQARIPVVLNGGDVLLVVLMAFGLALPMGSQYSVDAVRREACSGAVRGIAAEAPLLFLVGPLYLANAVFRTGSDAWTSGTALVRVYQLNALTRPLGELIASVPDLLVALNWGWLFLLAASPLLIVTTGWDRVCVVAAFVTAHVGILLTLDLTVFPLANLAGLTLFVPGCFWDTAARASPVTLPAPDESTVTALYPESGQIFPERMHATGHRVALVVSTTVLVCFVGWAALAVGLSGPFDDAGNESPDVEYPLSVFSPEPLSIEGWYVAPATLESGDRVDAYRLGPVNWDRPPDRPEGYEGTRWTHYLLANSNRVYAAADPVRAGFAGYLCRRAKAHYETEVRSVTVYFVADPVDGEPYRNRVVERAC